MNPIVILGGSFLLWISLTKRLPLYMALVHKKSATASNSPTSFNAGAASSSVLDDAAAAGQKILNGAYGG